MKLRVALFLVGLLLLVAPGMGPVKSLAAQEPCDTLPYAWSDGNCDYTWEWKQCRGEGGLIIESECYTESCNGGTHFYRTCNVNSYYPQ